MENRFSWVDKPQLIKRMQLLRTVTDRNKRSVIVLYEQGQVIKEFLNVDIDFQPATFAQAANNSTSGENASF